MLRSMVEWGASIVYCGAAIVSAIKRQSKCTFDFQLAHVQFTIARKTNNNLKGNMYCFFVITKSSSLHLILRNILHFIKTICNWAMDALRMHKMRKQKKNNLNWVALALLLTLLPTLCLSCWLTLSFISSLFRSHTTVPQRLCYRYQSKIIKMSEKKR